MVLLSVYPEKETGVEVGGCVDGGAFSLNTVMTVGNAGREPAARDGVKLLIFDPK